MLSVTARVFGFLLMRTGMLLMFFSNGLLNLSVVLKGYLGVVNDAEYKPIYKTIPLPIPHDAI